jgi:ABC-type transport system substrate-binding protein
MTGRTRRLGTTKPEELAMFRTALALLTVFLLACGVAWGQGASSAPKPILAGSLAKLDIKDAKIETARGNPRGTLNIGLHFGLDPGWFDPLQYAICGGPAAYICEPKIEALWAKHEASIDPAERDRLSKEIQRLLVEEYYLVPLYLQSFVHAVTPKVLPEGDAVHRRYWDTLNAPFPWPWEVWEVKG